MPSGHQDRLGLNSASACWHTPCDYSWRVCAVRWILGLVFVVAAAFAAIAAIDDERRVALVIGNSQYRYADPLPNPTNDAEAISRKLAALDFDVTTAVDLGRDEMEAAVLRFGQESEGADVVLIFYAGHGVQNDGENYLLSVDAQLDDPDDLREAGIEESRLHSVFAFVEPELSLLIMDACRTNPFQQTLGVEPGLASGGAASHEFGNSRSTKDLLIVFSAAPGQVALDGESGNSPFTTALLQWIDRPGLEVEQIFRHVRRTVIDLTGGQIPWVESSMTREAWLKPPDPASATESFESLLAKVVQSFENPLEREAAAEHFRRLIPDGVLLSETRDETRVAASGAIVNDAQADLEALRWLSIRTSDDPAVFEAFLVAFPAGKFAALAQDHIDALAQLAAERAEAETRAAEAAAAEFTPASGETPAEEPAIEPAPDEPALDVAALAAAEAELELRLEHRIAVQRLLTEIGTYGGALDGAIGPRSRAAIAAFQGGGGLTETGYLDPEGLDLLVEVAASQALASEQDASVRAAIHGLAAIAELGPGAAPTPIRVASIARHPEVEAIWRAVAEDFEADHPGYIVEFDTRPGAEYKAQLLAMLGSDAPPDILFTWGGGHLRAIAHAGFATDLTDRMASGWALTFKPGALANLTIDDRIYAAPSNMALVSLWANRTLLDRAGVEAASLETWEGLLAAVPRLKEAGVIPISIGGADRWPVTGYWAGLALAIGGRDGIETALAGEDGAGFEAPAFVEAGARLQDLAALEPFPADHRDRTNSEAVRAFIGGWTAMTLTGDWAHVEMSRNWPGGPEGAAETLVRIPFPPSDLGAGGEITLGGSDGWVLREGAPDPALDLLERLAGLEVQTELARLGHLVPSIAGADDAISDPAIASVATDLTLSRYHQLFLDQVLGPQAGEKLNDVAVALADGDLTPEAAAFEIEAAWSDARETLTIGVEPALPEPVE